AAHFGSTRAALRARSRTWDCRRGRPRQPAAGDKLASRTHKARGYRARHPAPAPGPSSPPQEKGDTGPVERSRPSGPGKLRGPAATAALRQEMVRAEARLPPGPGEPLYPPTAKQRPAPFLVAW